MPQRIVPLDLRQQLGAPSVRPSLSAASILARIPRFNSPYGGPSVAAPTDQAIPRGPSDPAIAPASTAPSSGWAPVWQVGTPVQGPQPTAFPIWNSSPSTPAWANQTGPVKQIGPTLQSTPSDTAGADQTLANFGIPPAQDFTAMLQGLMDQESALAAARAQAGQFNASLATASYDAQLQLIRQ